MPLMVPEFSLMGAQTLPVLGLQQEWSKQHSRFLGVLSVVTSSSPQRKAGRGAPFPNLPQHTAFQTPPSWPV